MRTRTVVAVSLSLIVLGLGAAKSWEVFERCGSLVTVIGILSFAIGGKKLFDAEMEAAWRKSFKAVSQRAVTPGSNDELEKWSDLVSLEADQSIAVEAEKRAKWCELGLIVVGTLVWGWGSLIGRI
ncbi:MAG: hypothetical protein ACM31D_02710 [Bacteroidota bacterium]